MCRAIKGKANDTATEHVCLSGTDGHPGAENFKKVRWSIKSEKDIDELKGQGWCSSYSGFPATTECCVPNTNSTTVRWEEEEKVVGREECSQGDKWL